MTDTGLSAEVAASHERWRGGRRYLNEHRHQLSQWAARNLYADHLQVGETGLLTRPQWMPTEPIPLEKVALKLSDPTPAAAVDGAESESAGVRPLRQDGRPYPTYAQALGDLARPRLYEDRPCYRLLDVELQDGRARLSFGLGTYFDVMNVSEAAAHELADAHRTAAAGISPPADLPFRSLIGDPCDLARRSIVPAISALTIRRTTADASFVLHWRDSASVAHGGGLYQVMPVGVFQPSDSGAWNVGNDFDLWRSLAREYSEEFLGASELRGTDGPLDYSAWPFYRSLTDARDAGSITVHLLGAGVDPLSLVADLLVAVVIDADVFDGLLGGLVTTNAEGRVVGNRPVDSGIGALQLDDVDGSTTSRPMQAAGAAGLVLSREHSSTLLASTSLL
jgi:hypothetical protein